MSQEKLSPDEERLFRTRFPRASYWVFGTKRPTGAPPATATHYRDPDRADRRFTQTSLPSYFSGRGGSSSEMPSILTDLLHASAARPFLATDDLPAGYLGPCWDCLAESSFHISQGSGDKVASSILGSCQHRRSSLLHSSTPLRLGPPILSFDNKLVPGISLFTNFYLFFPFVPR